MQRVKLWYDCGSPYSWFAFEALLRYQAAFPGAWELALRPVLVGGIFKATGNSAGLEIAARRRHFHRDLLRQQERFGVPLKFPSDIRVVQTTLRAQRLLTAADMYAVETLVPLSRALWDRIWASDQRVDNEDHLTEACRTAGIDDDALVAQLVDATGSAAVKERLHEATEEAVQAGAFGVPTMLVSDKSGDKDHFVFGSDRLHDVFSHLPDVPWTGPFPNSKQGTD